jgi:hypothetical protein
LYIIFTLLGSLLSPVKKISNSGSKKASIGMLIEKSFLNNSILFSIPLCSLLSFVHTTT